MRLLKTLLFLLIPVCFAFGQQSDFSVTLVAENGTCDKSMKTLRVVELLASGDSTLVWTAQDSACMLSIQLPLTPGNYRFSVKTQNNAFANVNFEVATANDKIALGAVMLESTVTDLNEVTITGVPKKFIVVDAEKTTITVENNPILEVSSIYDAILKIPGVVPYPGGGFALGGQLASVYFEGIPSSLSTTDLENLLKSLPATSVQKIELISNPGAAYDANVSGAIIDIISQGRVTKWISGTITLNAGFNKNQKYTPSLMMSGKGKKYTWQFQGGYSAYEWTFRYKSERTYNYFDTAATLHSERLEQSSNQTMYLMPSFTYRFNQNSFLQLNLGGHVFGNNSAGNSLSETGNTALPNLQALFESTSKGYSVNGGLKYRVFLDTLKRKLEIGVNVNQNSFVNRRLTQQQSDATTYSLFRNGNDGKTLTARADLEVPLPNWNAQWNLGTKYSNYTTLSEGAYRFNDMSALQLSDETFNSSLPFQYYEQNAAGYTEWKQRIGKKFSVTAGLRAEQFTLNGKVYGENIVSRDYFNVFPSVHTLYRITPDVLFTASYSRKINMPGYSQFDPNMTGYFDNYTQNIGNSALQPNFFHRSNAKLTIFDYLEVSVNYSLSNSVNLSEATADSNSYTIVNSMRTYNNVRTWSSFFALPVPFGFFKHGLDFFNQAIDIDAISFLYVYAENDRSVIPNYNYVNGNRSLWSFGAYSQFILPWKIRLNVEYNYTAKGMFQLTETTQPIHDVEMVFSREFKDKRWRAAITVQDVFNSNRNYNRISYMPVTVSSYSKFDTRVVWFKVSHSFGKYERPSLEEGGLPSRD